MNSNPSKDFGFRDIIDSATEGVIVTRSAPIEGDGPEIVYANAAMEKISGYTPEELLGNTPRMLQCEETSVASRKLIRDHLVQALPLRCRILNQKKSGQHYWVELSIVPIRNEQGQVSHFASIQRDITSFKSLEETLGNATSLDSQTRVLSRTAFLDALEKEWRRAYRHHSTYSLLLFRLQHERGSRLLDDAQLALLGETCVHLFRKEDSIGRLSQDEFCILMPETDILLAGHAVSRLRNGIGALAPFADFRVMIGTAERDLLDEEQSAILQRAHSNLT